MRITSFSGPAGDLRCDLLVVPVFDDLLKVGEPPAELDRALGGLLARLIEEEQFKGKPGQTLQVHTHGKVGAQRLLLVGAGSRGKLGVGELRHVGARGSRLARGLAARTVGMLLPPGLGDERAVQLAAEGLLIGRYQFDRYLAEEGRRPDRLDVALLARTAIEPPAFDRAVRRAEAVATAAARVRDLVNEPASEMTPRKLAEEALTLAKAHGLESKILGPAECRGLGMGMFLAVARGSEEEPRLIHLAYRPQGATRRVCLVGKGITFDSGGLSLKPTQSMEDMKSDMAGAATVIAAIGALAALEAPVEVHAIAACAENMVSGRAYKLGDVLRSMAGKTVEINNTDAEGRLTLGDAIAYARKLDPAEIVDLATLTGACMVALGPHIAGVMGNDDALRDRWLAAAGAAGEDMWPLPLPPRLKDNLKSDVADLKNTGERWGGALTAGLFLKEFADDTPWVHVDIAGPSFVEKEYGAFTKGGTGFGVATLVEYLAPRS